MTEAQGEFIIEQLMDIQTSAAVAAQAAAFTCGVASMAFGFVVGVMVLWWLIYRAPVSVSRR